MLARAIAIIGAETPKVTRQRKEGGEIGTRGAAAVGRRHQALSVCAVAGRAPLRPEFGRHMQCEQSG